MWFLLWLPFVLFWVFALGLLLLDFVVVVVVVAVLFWFIVLLSFLFF